MPSEENKSAVLVTVFLILFYGNWGWGVYRSFDRHGIVHGFASVGLPPYAWYRGIAAIWEKPLWREKYSDEVTNITRIALSERPIDAAKIVELSEAFAGRRKFVRSLPANVSTDLHSSFAGLLEAFPLLQLQNASAVFGNTEVYSEAEVLLKSAEAKFSRSPQIISVWNEYKENERKNLQMMFARKDVDKIIEDRDRVSVAIQAISIGTEKSWGQLRKSCLEMGVVQESDIKPFNHALWSSLLSSLSAKAPISKASL